MAESLLSSGSDHRYTICLGTNRATRRNSGWMSEFGMTAIMPPGYDAEAQWQPLATISG